MEKALNRQRVLLQHLQPSSSSSGSASLSASVCAAGVGASHSYHRTGAFGDDIVIVAAYRTAICRAKKGGFKDTPAEDLLASVLKAVIEKTELNPSEVGDIVVGTVLAPGSIRASECRMAAFYAGFPDTVSIRTVNRQCSSSLQAVADVAAAIKVGYYDIGIGAGLECMSINDIEFPVSDNPKANVFRQARDCMLPMGITSENVAQQYGVSREEQDQAAVESHRRAAAASASGKFKDEIIPVSTKIIDPKSGVAKPVVVSVDDGIRPSTNMEILGKLKPAFKKDGCTTAGNSSQVSDGAAAVLLMKRSLAIQKGLPILGVFRSFSVVGVDPAVMGIGPAVAIPAAVKSAGLTLQDIDLFEINEAFASQYVYCCKELKLDTQKVNVNGGAIALGHPLGATGARCVATLLSEMKRRGRDSRFGVISMCIGSGMGAAAVLERGDSVDELRNARPTSH
ncbi:3-ketoacyl-CoA thiolase 2, peroxisomal-like [Cucurbita maxima]|uniref:acetyl-CoA C-acyltransferase n=1 Tax=Cucurbita maxima TaxID=3661 RepID=A0A6J1HQB8_CUCMA|nr:3-ketoacyl-CoA thiolase 2, peroxisomal-like [Cucurbita maxima]XP_022967258.1 3-ketoacyl-CoA thiolase 2, peroxisomal-like [Cucurbita maxima]